MTLLVSASEACSTLRRLQRGNLCSASTSACARPGRSTPHTHRHVGCVHTISRRNCRSRHGMRVYGVREKAAKVGGALLDWIEDVLEKAEADKKVVNSWQGMEPVRDENDDDVRKQGLEKATFAAGCFWGVEAAFGAVPGVVSTEVGYTQGTKPGPTYKQVCKGKTGHAEAVRVVFDPKRCSFRDLLVVFWANVDPFDQFSGQDRGAQYRKILIWHTEEQRALAEESVREVEAKHGRRVRAEVRPAAPWWRAEEQHQRYLEKGGLDPEAEAPYWLGGFVDVD